MRKLEKERRKIFRGCKIHFTSFYGKKFLKRVRETRVNPFHSSKKQNKKIDATKKENRN
jgi:hypothetical protein